MITVRRLAAYIARHAAAPSFQPVTVFGHTCSAAGIFCGLRSLPDVGAERLAPSTPLAALRRSSTIRGLWKRAEWITGVKLPPPRDIWPGSWSTLADAIGLTIAVGGIVASIAFGAMQAGALLQIGGFVAAFAILAAAVLIGGIVWWWRRHSAQAKTKTPGPGDPPEESSSALPG